jgi:SAM-dependent methyltransferase
MSPSYTLAFSASELRRYQTMAVDAVRQEHEAWRAAGIVPGARVADIGCGPGTIVVELARLVSPGGSVDGVERDPVVQAAAAQVMAAAGVTNARIVTGEADASGLEPGAYDAVMMRFVLLHNGPRIPAIMAHLVTLLRPGGHLYLVDTDMLSRHVVPRDPDLCDLVGRWWQVMRRAGCDLQIGPKLGQVILDAGLELVSFNAGFFVHQGEDLRTDLIPDLAVREAVLQAGLGTEADRQRWLEAGQRWRADPAPKFIFNPLYRAVGRRPVHHQ